ncbi:MAG: hypothetical protein AAGI53_05760 [Planctomycetota bacterium]
MNVLRLYDTQTRSLQPFTPGDPSRVTFYTCGPTVYDDAHIGNFRAFLFADLLRRFIESPLCRVTGPDGAHEGPREVTHVVNITDVGHMTDDDDADGGGEDKMALAGERLVEAKKAGKLPEGVSVDPRDPRAIAEFFAARFIEDATKLGLKTAEQITAKPKAAAQLMPRASANVDDMKLVIERLARDGFAYAAGSPGARAVYFDVAKFSEYGQLSGNKLDQLKGGAGGRVSEANQLEKRHPADFLLWKEDASHLMKWPGPTIDGVELGDGYPGWHIECTAMSLGSLVQGGLRRVLNASNGSEFQVDLHSGGEDNIFPHHECENAQSCALTGSDRFARHWVHARYLFFEGGKMSKSKGTFYTARQLFEMGHEPAAVRLELIKTHYRANADFGFEGLGVSQRRLASWRTIAKTLALADANETEFSLKLGSERHGTVSEFADALHDDLNISRALAALDEGCNVTSGPYSNAKMYATFRERALDPTVRLEPLASIAQALEWSRSEDSPVKRARGSLHLIDHVLGVIFRPEANPELATTSIGVFIGVEPDPEVEGMLERRAEARKAKDFATSDAIRDELAAKGLAIKDVAGGQVEVTKA